MKHFQLLILLVLCYSNLWGQQTHRVCEDCELQSIKSAIAIAKEHDSIIIQKGNYKEFDILVDKPLKIIGEDFPLIDGEEKGEIFTVISDSVTLKNLLIKNVGTSYTKDHAAIRIKESRYFRIENIQLENLFFGIYLEKSKHGKVINNRILGDAVNEYNSGNGIQLWYSSDIEVAHNFVSNARDGIYLEFSDRVQIHDNTSKNNLRYGLHFMFSDHDDYTNNLFENNGAGVAVMFSEYITMTKNTFRKNWGTASYGILLKEINDAEISDNVFEENTIGINIEGSNRIDYFNNDFKNNGWAIKVRGACFENIFKYNNFLYNSFDISYNSKINDNLFENNYWSNYTGYDLDQNSIGDVPHRPVKLFSYIVNQTPETIILLRSLFMDLIDFSEKVSPVFTPDKLIDAQPLMKPVQ